VCGSIVYYPLVVRHPGGGDPGILPDPIDGTAGSPIAGDALEAKRLSQGVHSSGADTVDVGLLNHRE